MLSKIQLVLIHEQQVLRMSWHNSAHSKGLSQSGGEHWGSNLWYKELLSREHKLGQLSLPARALSATPLLYKYARDYLDLQFKEA